MTPLRLALLTLTLSLCACETVPCAPVVTPAVGNVLTCTTQQLTATLPAACKPGVSWTVSGGGQVDARGLYSAPAAVPDPSTVTLTAESTANPVERGTALLTLVTAMPQPAVTIGSTADDTFFQQQVVSSQAGEQAYAVLLQHDGSSWRLVVTRSDDGGATWSSPVLASDAPSMIEIEAPTIAIDPGDPRTIYVSYLLNAATSSSVAASGDNDSGKTVALAVSTNGGSSFTNYVLASQISGFGEWPTVAAPKPGSVVVEVPAAYPAGLRFFVDDAKGAGFSSVTTSGTNVLADEHFDVAPGHAGTDFNFILMNGGSFGPESPRLVTDGAGQLCAVYVAGYDATNADGQTRVVVQCSRDGGHNFGQALDVEVDSARSQSHHPIAAFGPQGQLVVTWWTIDPLDSHAPGDQARHLARRRRDLRHSARAEDLALERQLHPLQAAVPRARVGRRGALDLVPRGRCPVGRQELRWR